ncbi:MAG: LysR family transcriptional regulator [Bdellovibrionales bacterium]|nr:LysR family transcriptional regulator [Bdellovibrionales bacterium]
MNIEDLKLKEISVFLELIETSSIRELARRMQVSPGQITKLVKSLEQKLDMTLLDRSIKGVRATPQAHELMASLKSIREQSQILSGHKSKQKNNELLTFASTSFFSTHLLPQVFAQLEESMPEIKFRLLDLPPSQFLAVGLRNGFDYCVHLQNLDWPKTWESVKVGEVRWVLCCRKNHPLTDKYNLKKVLSYPFVYPVYWTSEGIHYGNDECPVSISKRIKGHETTTATSAVKILKQSQHIAYLPEIVVREELEHKEVELIHISSWPVVKKPVYLTVKADRVKKKRRDELMAVIKEILNPH